MGSHSHFQTAASAEDDLKTSKLAKAQRELEEMYMGVPDESVNLTFRHLAHVKQHDHLVDSVVTMPIATAASSVTNPSTNMRISKLPSLDFNRGMQASKPNQYHQQTHISSAASMYNAYNGCHAETTSDYNMMYKSGQYHKTMNSPAQVSKTSTKLKQQNIHDNMMTVRPHYEGNTSSITGANKIKQFAINSPVGSLRGAVASHQGIPHSKICAICDRYIYVFRHRCLVCGRVYCRNCVNIGMGEMSEGRKCVECLGRKYSQRYIQRAGKKMERWWLCCWHQSYPDKVKQQECKWAAKGPKITRRMTNNNDIRSRNSSIMMPDKNHALHSNYGDKQQLPSSRHHDNSPSFVSSRPTSPTISSPYLHF